MHYISDSDSENEEDEYLYSSSMNDVTNTNSKLSSHVVLNSKYKEWTIHREYDEEDNLIVIETIKNDNLVVKIKHVYNTLGLETLCEKTINDIEYRTHYGYDANGKRILYNKYENDRLCEKGFLINGKWEKKEIEQDIETQQKLDVIHKTESSNNLRLSIDISKI